MAEEGYYRLLGVSSQAPEREIKRAYHDLARKLHPDKASNAEEAAAMQRQFAAITKAYNTLKDPEKRREYDQRQGAQPVAAPADSGRARPTPSASPPAGGASRGARRTEGVDKRVEEGRLAVAERSYARGLQFSNMGDHARAVEFFETAVRNNPEESRYHARLAQAIMKSRRGFTRAVEVATKACELDPYNIECKLILARIYERAGSTSLAVKAYENVVKWDPENLEAVERLDALTSKDEKSSFKKIWKKLKARFSEKK